VGLGHVGVYRESYNSPLGQSHLLAVCLGIPLELLPITDSLLRGAFLDARVEALVSQIIVSTAYDG